MEDIQCYVDSKLCNSLPSYMATAQQSQRDVAFNVSIAQNQYMGIDLTNTVFKAYGYTTSSLGYVIDLLNMGYQSLYSDVYWNDETSKWQLCPFALPKSAESGTAYTINEGSNETVLCESNVTLSSLYSAISTYISTSDTDYSARVILINLGLSSVNTSSISQTWEQLSFGTSNLTGPEVEGFTDRIYTPSALAEDRKTGSYLSFLGSTSSNTETAYPSARDFLLYIKKRVIANAFYRNINPKSISYNFEKEDSSYFFLAGDNSFTPYTTIVDTANISCSWNNVIQYDQKSWRSVGETSGMQFSNSSLQEFSDCGFGPVINRTITSINDLLPPLLNSYWSWAPGQPFVSNSTKTSANSGPVAFQCAQLYEDGWRVGNCYDSHGVLCRQNNSEFGWFIGKGSHSYFEAENACSNDSYFAAPKTALDNAVSKQVVRNMTSTEFPVWIDLNDISVADCWVTGGPLATCPYDSQQSNRNGVALISVAAAVSALLLGVIFLLTVESIPLRRNQGRWRRLIAKYSEIQYEGVPS